MKNFEYFLISHQCEERLEVDAFGKRINECSFGGARHLDQTQVGIISGFAQKFSINCDKNLIGPACAKIGQIFRGGDGVDGRFGRCSFV